MKAIVRTKNVTLEVEGETQKDLFQNIAQAYEVFGESKCGVCQGEDIVPAVRRVVKGKKEFEYNEMVCRNPKCRAKLSYSLNMEGGTIFPNRKLLDNGKPATGDDRERGKYGPHNGWTKYRGENKEE